MWVEVADPNGHNCYHRPVIILTPSNELAEEDTIVGVVASNTASSVSPRPHSYIAVPYQEDGRVRTKLREPTVAVCEWLVEIEKSQIASDNIGGIVPPSCLKQILDKVEELHGGSEPQSELK